MQSICIASTRQTKLPAQFQLHLSQVTKISFFSIQGNQKLLSVCYVANSSHYLFMKSAMCTHFHTTTGHHSQPWGHVSNQRPSRFTTVNKQTVQRNIGGRDSYGLDSSEFEPHCGQRISSTPEQSRRALRTSQGPYGAGHDVNYRPPPQPRLRMDGAIPRHGVLRGDL